MVRFIVVLLSMFLLVACKTPVVGMQQHGSFTYEAVMQDQLVIGGVVSTMDELSGIERIRYGDMLARELVDEHNKIQIIPAGLVLKTMGAAWYQHWLDGYMLTGVVDSSDAVMIHRALPHARYLMLSRIEHHEINQSHSESETDVADSEEDRKKGEYEFVRVNVSLNTSRQMGATLMIYDLHQGLLAWSGYIRNRDINSNSASRTFDKHNRWREELTAAFVDALIEENRNSYPSPPSQEQVLRGIFAGFAEHMPEPVR